MEETQNLSAVKNNLSGYYLAQHRAKLFKDGIESNSAPFLPTDGKLNPVFIYNANTGMALEAKTMVPAVLLKAKNGYESNTVGSYYAANSAQTSIKKGEQGVGSMFKGKDGEFHSANLYFPEQMEQPERLQEFAGKNLKWEQRLKGQEFTITSPDVTEYLGAYVAACKSGASVSVSPEVAEQFKVNMTAVVNNELAKSAEKNPAIKKLGEVLEAVDEKSNKIIWNRQKELGIAQKQEKPQEQKPQQHKREKSQSMSR